MKGAGCTTFAIPPDLSHLPQTAREPHSIGNAYELQKKLIINQHCAESTAWKEMSPERIVKRNAS
ncbi:MAG: hypothetical protein A2845_03000 [Candidatus Lloydbacteria bacterium RIFCSPHIGHO2_01_FULL_49_22]|uniref:Uncharacterized protein n=1 Tax=Candidatus Lloydbacteria bacterium RIFCSPHIGHO2_01_FULL_49_22 TaxID=1798658 RepID=A0A1G2CVG9_9BACT|nr:MAG: hypothetical protein A2845_03000 [Candidatus Lloydbacteria bacterium RIFCSPHIGHO2_01_FULL_49_22]